MEMLRKKKEKSEHKNYIDMEVYLADIKRYRETAETQKMLLDKLVKENKKLKERINTMQEFIDYSEGVVQNAIGMLYEEGGEDKALDYLENCYATGDDKQYEEMERLYKDED